MKKEAKKTEPVWFSGPPPCVGWWPASRGRNKHIYRWWNGKRWSVPVHSTKSAKLAAGRAGSAAQGMGKQIEWTHRPLSWPIHARLDTSGGHWTYNTGKMPQVKRLVDVMLRSGTLLTGCSCWHLLWENTGLAGDIVAWREVK